MLTAILSTSQRSPTSNGCITNKKIMASNVVLHVLPNTNTTKSSCELRNMKKCVVATLSIRSHITIISIPTTIFNIWWSLFTAVFVSLRDNARALRSRNTFTWKGTEFFIIPLNQNIFTQEKKIQHQERSRHFNTYLDGSIQVMFLSLPCQTSKINKK